MRDGWANDKGMIGCDMLVLWTDRIEKIPRDLLAEIVQKKEKRETERKPNNEKRGGELSDKNST